MADESPPSKPPERAAATKRVHFVFGKEISSREIAETLWRVYKEQFGPNTGK